MPIPDRVNALNPNSPIDREKMAREYRRRIDALMADCKVDPSNEESRWMDLALALAERHVPGFLFEDRDAKSRRDGRWKRDMSVYVGMTRLIELGMSQRSAAVSVSKKLKRRRDGGKALTADAVDSLYRRLKNKAE
jgi:hypothetical protein